MSRFAYLLIHLGRHLGYFYFFFDILNNVAMNISIQRSCLSPFFLFFFFFFEYIPRSGTAGLYLILCLSFWRTAILFSTVAVPFYIATSSAQGFWYCHILINTLFFLDVRHPNRCEVVSCDFDLYFLRHEQCWTSFCVFVGDLCIFFGEMSI